MGGYENLIGREAQSINNPAGQKKPAGFGYTGYGVHLQAYRMNIPMMMATHIVNLPIQIMGGQILLFKKSPIIWAMVPSRINRNIPLRGCRPIPGASLHLFPRSCGEHGWFP